MKTIFGHIEQHTEVLVNVIEEYANSNKAIDAKGLAKKFGMDSMGSCTFGFEINTLRDENIEFQELVKNIFAVSWKWFAEKIINHNILKALKFRKSDPKVEKYLRNLLSEVSEFRKKNDIQRKDIFHYVDQMTNEESTIDSKNNCAKLNSEQKFLQLYSIFLGGFGTSASAISFVLLELSQNQVIQDKLRQYIHEIIESHEKLSYELVMKMEYLDCIVMGKFSGRFLKHIT